MARTARNSKLDTRTARLRLEPKKNGHWQTLSRGRSLGYRKGAKSGRWLVRLIDETGRHEAAIGDADDIFDADGVTIFDFGQAQEKARTWFQDAVKRQHGEHVGRKKYTVADAMRDYMTHYHLHGKSAKSTQATIDAHILPSLGQYELAKLTSKQISHWHQQLATAPARLRSAKNAGLTKHRKATDNEEEPRRRKATANRILTVLKAALNHAWGQGRAADDTPWRKVKSFKSVDAPVIRYLNQTELVRLVNASQADLRQMVQAALHTGCRYGELARLTANDFNSDTNTLTIRTSKAGKPRHVVLTEEGAKFFAGAVTGKKGRDLLFTRDNGSAWGKSHQHRPLKEACAIAKIEPAISFHVLRHTHGSLLAMQGVPLNVIAHQLGHADTRMTERHYAHLSPNYVADTIRRSFPKLDINGGMSNVMPLPLPK